MDAAVFALTVIVVGLIIYFIPALIANHRKHPQMVPILLLDIFLGWTLVGWVAALVWSVLAFPDVPVNKMPIEGKPSEEYDPSGM